MFFLDLTYFTPNIITIIATTDSIIMATKSPLQRIFSSLCFESLQIHFSDVLSEKQGSVDCARLLVTRRKDSQI